MERRNAREFIKVKPYVRIAATLSTVKPENNDAIPPFNPFDLYAEKKRGLDGKPTLQGAPADKPASNQFVTSRLLELAGGFLPEEDKQELTDDEAERYVAEADAVYAESAAQLRPAIMPEEDAGSGRAEWPACGERRKTRGAGAYHGVWKK